MRGGETARRGGEGRSGRGDGGLSSWGDFGEQAPENDLGASPLNSLNLIGTSIRSERRCLIPACRRRPSPRRRRNAIIGECRGRRTTPSSSRGEFRDALPCSRAPPPPFAGSRRHRGRTKILIVIVATSIIRRVLLQAPPRRPPVRRIGRSTERDVYRDTEGMEEEEQGVPSRQAGVRRPPEVRRGVARVRGPF